MTDREKAIVEAYTGYVMLAGDKQGIFYDYVKEKFGRYIFTHELADKKTVEALQAAARPDFMLLCAGSGPAPFGYTTMERFTPDGQRNERITMYMADRLCGACGEHVTVGWAFCPYCGKTFVQRGI